MLSQNKSTAQVSTVFGLFCNIFHRDSACDASPTHPIPKVCLGIASV